MKFKQGMYKYYAPWLFKLYRLQAYLYLLYRRESVTHHSQMAQVLWHKWLAKRFKKEILGQGHTLYTGQNLGLTHKGRAYILGCGASINSVTENEWEIISEHLSVGLNNFYVHDFTPNMYFCEYTDIKKFIEIIHKYLLDNVARKTAKVFLNGMHVLVKGDCYVKPKVQDPYFFVPDNIKISNRNLIIAKVRRYFDGRLDKSRLSHHRSNLDTVINFCVREGVKEIFLVGVDLNSHQHFWDEIEQPAYLEARECIGILKAQLNIDTSKGGTHLTASKEVAASLGNITIIEYLELLQDKVLDDLDVQLYVCNPASLLAGILPVKPIGSNE